MVRRRPGPSDPVETNAYISLGDAPETMLPDRYTFSNFRRALGQPGMFVEELGRLPFTAHAVVQNTYATLNGYGEKDAIRVMDEDWDTLIVLDACRYDLFEEFVDTDAFDSYRRVISIDSNTTPWSIKNFKGGQHGDTVYVNGNPGASKTVPDEFHRFIEVWTDRDAHDANTYTIPAESVTEYTRDAIEEYPDKRLIVHYVQPHKPFVPRPDLVYRSSWSAGERVGLDMDDEPDPDSPEGVWDALRQGVVDFDEVWQGYGENLEYVMADVFELLEVLPGRTVVTSDHGNMLGERTVTGRTVYGHPGGLRTRILVEVPWAVVDRGERKEIRDGGVRSEGSVESDIIEDRLAALGYKE